MSFLFSVYIYEKKKNIEIICFRGENSYAKTTFCSYKDVVLMVARRSPKPKVLVQVQASLYLKIVVN